ncbi:MAG: DUF5698 domain-containing protein [Atopostipes suicloacalis]|nr:DUF5698 domain-containing protein [Atopostipes suicloacalis]MDN6730697.1 DUF5698 domain-containing protein [Atopostipes suicloacalis]
MLELLMIFVAKVIEVSLTTLRTVFISRGEKAYASAIAFVEILIWLVVAGAVLNDITENPSLMFVYALGFTAGSYVGLVIEEKLGLGYSNVQVITNVKDGKIMANSLRELGNAVTTIDGHGRDSERVILSTYVKRKSKDELLKRVEDLEIQGVVTVSETQKIYGGFGIK